MAPDAPRLIGIAGPSGAGKTELALSLVRRFPGGAAVRVPLDSYYRDLADLEPALRDQQNFDHPSALDHALLAQQLAEIALGREVVTPVYEFATHARGPAGRTVSPGGIVILDGLFALYWAEIRELLHARVYVDADHTICLQRRIDRDTHRRGRTEQSVREQYERTVRPMFEEHVRPTKRFADLVLSGEDSPEANAAAVSVRFGLQA